MASSDHARILLSAYEYHPQGVSEGWTAYQLVQAVTDAGWRPIVLTRASVNKPRWFGVAQVKCFTPKPDGFWALNYGEYAVRATLLAWRMRKRLKLIHHVSPITLRVPCGLGAIGVPFIWGPVGGTIPFPPGFKAYSHGWGLGGQLRRLDRLRLRADPTMLFTQSTADRIVVTSTMAAENLPRRFLDKSVVIPGGVSAATVLDDPVAEEAYIFSSGRLVPYKALDLLIRSMAGVRGLDGVKLIITGDGPLRKHLEELIVALDLSKKVELRGRVSRFQNRELMRRSLFCVFPSLREAFGNVNLEAMAAHKPVVVTDWGGPRDLIVHNLTGMKILGRSPDEHVELLTAAIQNILDNTALRRDMGAAAAKRVRNEFTWQALSKRYDELYEAVCK